MNLSPEHDLFEERIITTEDQNDCNIDCTDQWIQLPTQAETSTRAEERGVNQNRILYFIANDESQEPENANPKGGCGIGSRGRT